MIFLLFERRRIFPAANWGKKYTISEDSINCPRFLAGHLADRSLVSDMAEWSSGMIFA